MIPPSTIHPIFSFNKLKQALADTIQKNDKLFIAIALIATFGYMINAHISQQKQSDKEQMSKLNTQIKEMTQAHEQERSVLNTQIEEMTQAHEQERSVLNTQIEEMTQAHEQERSVLNTQIKEMTQKHEEQISALSDEIAAMKKAHAEQESLLKNQIKSLQRQQLENDISHSQQISSFPRIGDQVQELTDANQQLKMELEGLRRNFDRLSSSVKSSGTDQSYHQLYETEIKNLRSNNKLLENTISRQKQQILILRQENRGLQEKLSAVRTE